MGDLNDNTMSLESMISSSYNFIDHNNPILNNSDFSDYVSAYQNLKRLDWITIGIGLPLTLIVMVAVFLQVKKDQGVPVYVINLLFSDLIQFCGRIIVYLVRPNIGYGITSFGLMASVGFMVCISLERYLVIAKPLWYRFRRNIKTYVVVCGVVWTFSLPFPLTTFLTTDPTIAYTLHYFFLPCLLLLPFPLLIFFLVGTIKALSGALSVPVEEKRRITAIQVVVLLIYTLLFLPSFVYFMFKRSNIISFFVALVSLYIAPFLDPTLYLLTRKSFLDKFLASLCSCKASDNQEMSSKDTESTTAPHTETV